MTHFNIHGALFLFWLFPFVGMGQGNLTTPARVAPRLRGILGQLGNPELSQQARFRINYQRLGRFKNHPSQLFIWQAPLHIPFNAGNPLNHGATHIASVPALRSITNTLSRSQRASFISDISLHGFAGILASSLPTGPSRASLELFAPKPPAIHRLLSEQIAIQLGHWVYDHEVVNAAGHAEGQDIVCIDVEDREQMRKPDGSLFQTISEQEYCLADHLGALYLGLVRRGKAQGKPIGIFSYGHTLSKGLNHSVEVTMIDGVPSFEHPSWVDEHFASGNPQAPISQTRPLSRALKEAQRAFIARDNYLRSTWDDASFYKQSGRHYVLIDGKRVFQDQDHTGRLYGQLVQFKGADPDWYHVKEAELVAHYFLDDVAEIELEYFWLNGLQYRIRKSQKMPGWEQVEIGRWSRFTTEPFAAPGYKLGKRPIHPKLVRNQIILRSALCGGVWYWADEVSVGNQGVDRDGTLGAYGELESVLGARQVLSMIKTTWEQPDFWFIRGNRAVWNGNNAGADHVQEKMLIRGFLYPNQQGGITVTPLLIYPAMDETDSVDVTWWYTDGRYTSPGFLGRIVGRDIYLDAVDLPVGGPQADPRYLRFQYKSINGTTYTYSGDYRYPISGNPIPPPLYQGRGYVRDVIR